jgi:hypothetical protein
MKKLLLFLVALFLWAGSSWAQVNTYTFASSAGSYTAITGTVSTATGDDGAQNINLPFSFTYNGIAYSTGRISTNGWLEMGQTYTSTGYSNSLASTTIKPILCPLWDDLYDDGTSDIQYSTTGVSPNQVFTVQWKSIRWTGSGGTRQNFQVKIYQTTNVIEFIYGTMAAPSGVSASIGINDEVGGSSHYISITPAATPTYSSATANNSVNNITYLTSGTTYTFTPPVIVTPPNCATIGTPVDVASNIATTATLNWTSGGGAPTGYKLYYGTDNPPTNIVNGTDLGNVLTYNPSPDMSYSTTYYWKVVAYNANGDATGCPDWSFSTMADPTISSFPSCQSFDGATFVPTGWTNSKTAGTGAGLWDRQTSGTNPTCTAHTGAGMTRFNCYDYTAGTKGILVSPPINFPEDYYKVKFWMYRDAGFTSNADLVNVYYNTSSDLTGTPLLLGTINRKMGSAPIVASAGWYQYEFTMPAGSGGDGRYVIFEAVSAYGNNIFLDDICLDVPSPTIVVTPGTLNFGLVLNGNTSAELSYIMTCTNLEPASGDITITPPANFEVSLTSGGPYSSMPITASFADGTLSTTVYCVFKPTDASTNYSGNITNEGGGAEVKNVAVSGTSPCDATTAPFTEGFENATFAPDCWTKTIVSGSYNWVRSTAASGNGEGTASAYANFYSQSSGVYELKSMPFDISGAMAPVLKFNYAYATYSGEIDRLDIYYSNNLGSTWTLLLAMPGGEAPAILNTGGTIETSFIPTSEQWGTQKLSLPTGTNMVKFKATSNFGNNLYLDNIQVFGEEPDHFTVTGPASVTAGSNSTDFTIQVYDLYDNPTTCIENTCFALTTNSTGQDAGFSDNAPCIAAGEGNTTFTYIDSKKGTFNLTSTFSSGDAGLTGQSETAPITVNILPWLQANISTANGSTESFPAINAGTFEITATGISAPKVDVHNFVYQQLCGTGTVIAHLSDLENGGWAGVEMRESNAPGAKTFLIKTKLFSPSVLIGYRTATNGNMSNLGQTIPSLKWMKIQRNGNTFTVYISYNGTAWVKRYGAIISMANCINAGFFTENTKVNQFVTSTFDQAEVVNYLKSGEETELEVVNKGAFDIEFYPNPASDQITIVAPDNTSKIKVSIINASGMVVESDQFNTTDAIYNLQQLKPGVYLIRFEREGILVNKRLVIF